MEIWLLLPPFLIQADIRALARVCVRLRMIFRPLVTFKVTITLNDSRSHRKVLAITRIRTFLDSVVGLEIGENSRYLFQVQYLFSPTLFTLFRALPAMRQLHTIQLSLIFLAETHLRCILSSSYITHLVLYAIQLPKISRLSPPNPNLRKLTLTSMASWDAVRPLLVHLAASLEYLQFHFCDFEFGPRSRLQLPPFPSLRELRHQNFGNEAVLEEVFQVSQVTHLHLFGTLDPSRAAFPKSLQHLSTEDWVLIQLKLRPTPVPLTQLISLSIQRYQEWEMSYHLAFSALVCDHFPRIISLHLRIQWALRNVALVMARSQHNVQEMELSIVTRQGLDSEGWWGWKQVEILNDYLQNNTLPGALQGLRLEVVQRRGNFERGLALCSRWVYDDVIHPVKGLGGSDLKSIDVSFVLSESGLGRERRIWKRWAKLPDEDWQIEGAL